MIKGFKFKKNDAAIKLKGIRRRVIISFLGVVLLLLFSTLVSYFELKRLGDETANILESNRRNIELVREMLSGLQSQNVAFIQMTIFHNAEYDVIHSENIDALEQVVEVTLAESPDNALLDSISYGVTQLRALSDEVVQTNFEDEFRPRVAFYSDYKLIYDKLIDNIYEFMTSSQATIEPRAQALYHNAYRAVTPVLISLAVMVAILLMLLYFVLLYLVNPVLGINKSLGDYLSFKLPFKVKQECKDEVEQLRDNIELLIKSKNKEA
ncbi:MAG: hypothetical protein SNJ33_04455 [Rikenellaceae bacterium]